MAGMHPIFMKCPSSERFVNMTVWQRISPVYFSSNNKLTRVLLLHACTPYLVYGAYSKLYSTSGKMPCFQASPIFVLQSMFSIIHGSERVAKNGGAGKKASEIHSDYSPLQMFSLDRNGVPN